MIFLRNVCARELYSPAFHIAPVSGRELFKDARYRPIITSHQSNLNSDMVKVATTDNIKRFEKEKRRLNHSEVFSGSYQLPVNGFIIL